MINHYETLKISPDATSEEIKQAYRKLAKKFHPDRNPNDKVSENIFIEISNAYGVLSDRDNRKKYDQMLANSADNIEGVYKAQGATNDENSQNSTSVEKMFAKKMTGFEEFFGFNEDGSKVNKNNQKSPIDATDLFESYFNRTK